MRWKEGRRWLLAGMLAAGVIVAGVWLLGRFAGLGPFAPEPWKNVKTGQVAGPGFASVSVPYESSVGCGGSKVFASSISWLRGAYMREWTGPADMVAGTYAADVSLPPGAVFTGWERGGRRLWVNPDDQMGPGRYRYLYVVTPDHVERWPLARFGCA